MEIDNKQYGSFVANEIFCEALIDGVSRREMAVIMLCALDEYKSHEEKMDFAEGFIDYLLTIIQHQ